MKSKLFIRTYGCQMNEYDSGKLADLLAITHNMELVDQPQDADLIILNTCAVRAKASSKVFSELGRLRKHKQANPHLVIAVGGCVAMEEQAEIFRRAPYVDMVFGPQAIHQVPNLYDQVLQNHNHALDVNPDYQLAKFSQLPPSATYHPTAYLSIMEGCDKFCSYCIVPYTRGPEVSRPASEILAEVAQLVAQGTQEIHLLGQNVNSYRDPISQERLAQLVHRIAEFPEITRIRFTTSHPLDFDDQLIAMFATEPKLATQIHLPLQSGSDRILDLMNRGYHYMDYRSIIHRLRQASPQISVSSDFIVGFPGETTQDFEATLQAVAEIAFDNAFSFIYSPRPNTPAAQMVDNVSLAEKKQRLAVLQNQLMEHAQRYNETLIGTRQMVLITHRALDNPRQFSGKSSNNRTVNLTTSEDILGKLVEVTITHALPNSLKGKID